VTAPNELDAQIEAFSARQEAAGVDAPRCLHRESPAIEVDEGIKGEQVVAALDAVIASRGAPMRIRVDNGPEFVSNALDRWAYQHGVVLDFSRLGKPTANAFVESFNGRLREECRPFMGTNPGAHRHYARSVSLLADLAVCRGQAFDEAIKNA